MDWKQLKKEGSEHYKTGGGVEPIDLYLAAGLFRHYAVTSIIKYAFRNRNNEEPVRESDMHKIIDLAQKLIAANHVDDEYKPANPNTVGNGL